MVLGVKRGYRGVKTQENKGKPQGIKRYMPVKVMGGKETKGFGDIEYIVGGWRAIHKRIHKNTQQKPFFFLFSMFGPNLLLS